MLIAGAVGYGGSVMVQNAGIGRTSVTHAALLIGAVPVLVAIIAAVWYRAVARPVIDRVFPFEAAQDAYRHFESRAHFGKVVISHG